MDAVYETIKSVGKGSFGTVTQVQRRSDQKV
jgi:hypothetical protein